MTLPPLTICTVSFHHAAHLRLNIDLTARLNPSADIRWIVAENTPVGSELRLAERIAPNVDVLPTEAVVPAQGSKGRHYHIAALHEAIARARTRYMLILDPDFYAIRPNWYAELVARMQVHNLSLFGAPWNPRHPRKYRYFPCVHFTLVDRDAFAEKPYTPDILAAPGQRDWLKAAYNAPGKPASFLRRKWRTAVLRRLFPTRWSRGWAIQDTGSALFARYWMGENIPNECLVTIFDPDQLLARVGQRQFSNRILEAILPEHVSYIPKRRDSYSTTGGFLPSEPLTNDWESFLWNGRPFGFHLRGNSLRDRRDAQAEVDQVEALLESLIAAADTADG
jgi:hypothetical protein